MRHFKINSLLLKVTSHLTPLPSQKIIDFCNIPLWNKKATCNVYEFHSSICYHEHNWNPIVSLPAGIDSKYLCNSALHIPCALSWTEYFIIMFLFQNIAILNRKYKYKYRSDRYSLTEIRTTQKYCICIKGDSHH